MNRDLMKDFLRDSFPNPERKGCPDEETLQALAVDRLAPNHPALLHVGSCSECYAEYLHLRQDFEENRKVLLSVETASGPAIVPAAVQPAPAPFVSTSARSKGMLFTTAAAVLVGIGGTVGYLQLHHAVSKTSGRLIASSAPIEVPVDLYGAVTTRSVGDDATPIQEVSLPAAIVHLAVTLPRYSQTGEYGIFVSKDRAGREPVAKGIGTAAEVDQRVRVSVTLDLRTAQPGAYFLATVRGSDNGTYYYPLQVR